VCLFLSQQAVSAILIKTHMISEPEKQLPPYPGISLHDIYLVTNDAEAEFAYAHLSTSAVLGFDTETKPVFMKGQRSDGPHLIQLATESKAFLFPVVQAHQIPMLKSLLENPQILKVGFGLVDDLRHLKSKFGIETANVLDLARLLRESKQRDMGAKAAVEKFFGMRLSKSKKISTSNWAQYPLHEKQILYAANDAQVALLVYQRYCALKKENSGSGTL